MFYCAQLRFAQVVLHKDKLLDVVVQNIYFVIIMDNLTDISRSLRTFRTALCSDKFSHISWYAMDK